VERADFFSQCLDGEVLAGSSVNGSAETKPVNVQNRTWFDHTPSDHAHTFEPGTIHPPMWQERNAQSGSRQAAAADESGWWVGGGSFASCSSCTLVACVNFSLKFKWHQKGWLWPHSHTYGLEYTLWLSVCGCR